ncbi:MAG: xanthine dehydrogenase family protein molybdopterin-binding subunit [Ardenticatenaceae bacterium]|nr:xanthine dehydrogenase family protein molybdopterin-binding subunit [Ardenticatenaceae bacterium]
MAEEFSVIGKRVPVADGFEKVTGQARYAGDIHLPGMLHAKILRSPHPHANVLKIDTGKAEALEGVVAVLTPDNLPLENIPETFGVPIFTKHPRMVGEAIAAVAARDVYTAHEALKLIDVEYELLPAVYEAEEAMKPNAPKLTEKGNLVERSGGNPFTLERPGVRDDEAENAEQGMARADEVFEETFTTHMQLNASPEQRAVVALWEGGKLIMWNTSQQVFPSRDDMARSLGIRLNDVRSIAPYRGGGYGAANASHGQGDGRTITALLAKMTNRPVKLEFTRPEEFIIGQGRNSSKQTLRIGVTKEGRITAIDVKAIFNTGSTAQHGANTPSAGFAYAYGGLYRTPARNDITIVLTNKPSGSEFRGFGGPENNFCLESLVDEIAYKLGLDPLEFRLKNVESAPTWYGTGPLVVTQMALPEVIQQGSERFGWKEKFHKPGEGPLIDGTKKRGVGMALWVKGGGLGDTYGMVKVYGDGSVHLFIGAANIGQGMHTALGQIVAEVLGVPWEDVRPHWGDTDVDAWDSSTSASRVAMVGGNAFKLAAEDAKAKILAIAARTATEQLGEVKPEELDIKDRQVFVKADASKKVPLKDVLRSTPEIVGLGHWSMNDFDPRQGMDPSTFPKKVWDNIPEKGQKARSVSTGAMFVEAEVDIETGAVRFPHVVIAADIGKAIHPTVVEGQLEGGFLQQMAWALMEGVIVDEGTGIPTNASYWLDYKILTAKEIPDLFEVLLVEKPNPQGAFGLTAVGEATTLAPAPAIANAIRNAIGVRIKDLPITPDKILAGLGSV